MGNGESPPRNLDPAGAMSVPCFRPRKVRGCEDEKQDVVFPQFTETREGGNAVGEHAWRKQVLTWLPTIAFVIVGGWGAYRKFFWEPLLIRVVVREMECTDSGRRRSYEPLLFFGRSAVTELSDSYHNTEDAVARERALRTLAEIGGERAYALISEVARDTQNPDRRVAIITLANLVEPRSEDLLLAALEDDDVEIILVALRSIRLLHSPKLRPAVLEVVLRPGDSNVVEKGLVTLSHFVLRDGIGHEEARSVARTIAPLLKHESRNVREAAQFLTDALLKAGNASDTDRNRAEGEGREPD